MKSNQLHFLITAGGTREYIDPVRFITNASSGKMGLALAEAALKAGHKVTLITTLEGSRLKTQNSKPGLVKVETADEMFKAVKKYFVKCNCLVMAAAVADYAPVKKSKVKIKKSQKDLLLRLKPTTDILAWAGKHKKQGQIVAGFALEDRNLRKNAEKKLNDKNLDMIIANSPAIIEKNKTAVQIKQANRRWINLPSADKKTIAVRIIRLSEDLLQDAAKK